MGKKKEYKEANRRFLKKLSFQEGVCALPCGIYYKVLETGEVRFLRVRGVLLPCITKEV